MGRARARSDAEVSLFPFLSILVCLIGALVLLIVILTMVQSRLGDGRTPEELRRATEAQRLNKEIAADTEQARILKSISPAAAAKDALDQKLKAIVELRRELEIAADKRQVDAQTSAELQKELENLLIQIEQMAKERAPLTSAIEKLKAELAARNKKPDDIPPAVIVQPSGGGTSAGAKLFFVECGGAGIVLHKSKTEQVRITAASIGVDAVYDGFLAEAKQQPGAMVLFLLRDDGLFTYQRAAGWAENQFGLRTGKLPLPGKGPADLGAFLGK